MKRNRNSSKTPDDKLDKSATSYREISKTFKKNIFLHSNSNKISVYDFVKSWANDTDMDDLYDLYISSNKTKLDLDFRFINALLHYGSTNKTPKELKDHLEYIRTQSELSSKDTIENHVNNIRMLYTSIKKFPMSNLYMKPTTKITLYRGFRYSIDLNDVIVTDKFLSTSVSKNSALRFMNTKNSESILMKINVPNRYFHIFPYVYFSTYIKLPYEKQEEAEFLLNVGAILEKKKVIHNVSDIVKYPIMNNLGNIEMRSQEVSYTLVEYNFVGWDETKLDKLLHNIEYEKM